MHHLGVAIVELVALVGGAATATGAEPPDVLALVDPFVGTGAHGHTYPGATVPFGMVQVSPDTHTSGWDWCSGYHHTDRSIIGFSHTHLSGTGIGDMLDVLLMPTVGPLQLEPGTREDPDAGYRSRFSHGEEGAGPGYYAVRLADTGIRVELTATGHVGFQRYTFPESDAARVVLDLDHRIGIDTSHSQVLDSEIEVRGDDTIVGWRRITRWARSRPVYFAARFSKPFAGFGLLAGTETTPGRRQARGKRLKAWVDYRTAAGEAVLVRVALSPTSVEGALRNLEAEAPRADFDGARKAAADAWRGELSKIRIEGGTKKQRRTFYTALYHSFLAPTLFSDADSSYRGLDGQVRKADGFRYHSTFSLWDTYRAAHPLYCLVQRARTRDLARTLVRMAIESPEGQMPVWPLANDETNCMIGFHSASVLAEAWRKGIRDFDLATAFERMKAMVAKGDYRGLGDYGRLGWVPSDHEGESVSKTLEYSYDDWALAHVAKALGRTEDEKEFLRRDEGRRFAVSVERGSPGDTFIQSATLGGEPLPRAWITHDDVMTAGELRVVLGPKPNPGWAIAPADRPPSMTR